MTVGASSQTLVSNGGQEASKLPQYVAAISATLGGFVMGSVLAWTSPTNAKLAAEYHFPISSVSKSLIGGLVSIGAMIGALLGGMFCKVIGRKRGLIFLALPSCVGWGLIIWAERVEMIIAGRVVLGLVIGVLTVACPLYTTEIAETSIRGTLGTYFQLQCTLGIFFDYVVGNVVRVFYFNILCAVLPLVMALLMTFMPETPQFYLSKKNEASARKALQWLRGKHYDVSGEIQAMQASIEKREAEKTSFCEAFSTTPAKRGLIVGLGIMFFQQLSGVNGVIFYTADIFRSAGSKMTPEASSMIVGGVSFAATYISTLIIDKLGRKPLLFVSVTVCALSSGALGLYFFLQEHGTDVTNLGWLPVTSLSVFIIVFSLGLGPIPWMFLTEIFPSSIASSATSICCLTNWLFCFIVTFSFDSVCNTIHQSFTFWGFSLISVLGAVFVLALVPETKGKSIDEIQRTLGGDAPSNVHNEKPSRIA